mmetsp:Transcript_38890/g.47092  ORF Transcript_38890/g.47092 Transcript_38890/m.47092 type:complete len:220 (-) Transcript_38890:238-897(-)|eukprot:CAMPEP_0197853666 /NCGR_PEP_ID=MMETSP1438-20131217/23146_1 /TAXON_ID=1461541 /ORGANISM="Pterosperma sp., Strain CCMP1384" /LENGTH=219 /DNA_ID=CAMNT_0043468147 /DNA_START=369 /DNA_END=1028 /DNA_ORIENTATION=+
MSRAPMREARVSHTSQGRALANPTERPWESGAVKNLVDKLGHDPSVKPMMIEGPVGTVLASVGEDRDNNTAVSILTNVNQDKFQEQLARAQQRGPNGEPPPQPPPSQTPVVRKDNMDNVSFGAVYEHRVNGQPMYVGTTSILPEARFMLDANHNKEIQAISMQPTHKAEVVWAGIGRGPVGKDTMDTMTEAIQSDRAQRQHVKKLAGPKPYSNHGFSLQ